MDIDRGALWFPEISQQLGDTSVGVICLTQENKEKPWILFEAGALAKGLNSARVCTFLIDLQSADIAPPLSQFNHTFPNKESVRALVTTINAALSEKALHESVLAQVFETYWPQFESDFASILKSTKSSPQQPRAQGDILEEILEGTRSLSNRLRILEQQQASLPSAVPKEVFVGNSETPVWLTMRDAGTGRNGTVTVTTRSTKYGGGDGQPGSVRKRLAPGDSD